MKNPILLVRGDCFCKKDGKLYIVGSASNFLYDNNAYYMGKIRVLGWLVDEKTQDVSMLEEYKTNDKIELSLYPLSKNIQYRKRIVKKEILGCTCASLKFTLTDAILAYRYCKRYKKPFVIESSTDLFRSLWYHGGSIKYKIMAIPMHLLIRFCHFRSRYIVYVSKHYLQKKYPSNAIQTGCPDVALNVPDESILDKRISKIKSFNKNDRPFVLGLIGATHAEYRGHDRLIEIVYELTKQGYNVIARFLGGGKADDKRIQKAKELNVLDRIEFCGRKNHNGVLLWIDDIDCLVMPTMAESLGRSVIEAMSRGCPVIGTRETAISEQIGSDCVVSAKRINEYVNVIKLMYDNSNFLEACAEENFYRSKKYASVMTNEIRKAFYDYFYETAFLKIKK